MSGLYAILAAIGLALAVVITKMIFHLFGA
jgi:hypothetical protein